ncbi:MAG: aldo/keto reductase [Clostridia bacterium]|nr:aldo/keto reductase [Clostridia bacterium]
MLYADFKDQKLSMLGFGTMRLPTVEGKIDEKQVEAMTDYAIRHGVNYFDTAIPYHDGLSEVVIGRVLNQYPRESWYLADKFPGHQIAESYDPQAVFEDQLRKCGVDYFDFYLLHNVYENSIQTYQDPRWGILDYFRKQKQLGRIKHLGFSCHGSVKLLQEFLDYCGDDMEFCQIQLNWLDWTLQDAKAKVALLNERNIPIIVMEPLRGGRLCRLTEEEAAPLKRLRPESTGADWGLRFLQQIPGVKVILSGMSNQEQMQANVASFEEKAPLSAQEWETLLNVAEGMKDAVPCTACRYCTPHCPMELDIPMLLAAYNEFKFNPGFMATMKLDALEESKRPSACIGCGSCEKMCPQHIQIPQVLETFAKGVAATPSWAQICRQRDEAARKLREAQNKG